ncbi:acyltransferase family protein [Nocardia sp. JMUB6875]|uniref:acyltransferase family protein n=1 Tax=Nocardia sp. JMUB6875 TaxID=3158170 RepID=UPI0034E84DCF
MFRGSSESSSATGQSFDLADRRVGVTRRVERFMGIAATRSNSDAYLDGVRALAVLAVVTLHSRAAAPKPDGMRWFGLDIDFVLRNLYLGVDLFFVLSGFLLARPWFRAEFAGRPRPDLATFWRRRFARIAPGYYFNLSVTVFVFAATVIPAQTLTGALGLWTIGAHLLFVQNYVPAASTDFNYSNIGWWTLTVDMTWYLVLPVVATVSVGRRWKMALPTIIAISIGWILLARSGLQWLVDVLAASSDEYDLRVVGVSAPPPRQSATPAPAGHSSRLNETSDTSATRCWFRSRSSPPTRPPRNGRQPMRCTPPYATTPPDNCSAATAANHARNRVSYQRFA